MQIETTDSIYEIFFEHVQVEITSACNMMCQHCRDTSTKNINMDFDTYSKIIDFVNMTKAISPKDLPASEDAFKFTISGGEPLLHPQLIDFLQYTKKKDIDVVTITTNGSLFNNEILKQLNNIGFKRLFFQISLDSINKTRHDEFRGHKGAFDKAIGSIKMIKSVGMSPTIRMTVTPHTISEMDDMFILAEELGVEVLGFASVIPIGSAANKELALKPEDKIKFIEKVADLRRRAKNLVITTIDPIKLVIPDSPWSFKDSIEEQEGFFSGCAACIGSINFTVEGNLTPCPVLPLVITNIKNKEVNDVLNDYCNSNVVSRLIERQLDGKCGICKSRYICGGCRALAYADTNNIFGSDPSCTFFKSQQ